MDPIKFKELTTHLLKYSVNAERDILVEATTPHQCEYCPRQVVGQVIMCEAHKLGTKQQHFKHKCYICRQSVFDGSYKFNPRQLRPISNYTPKALPQPTNEHSVSKNGKVMGRPRKGEAPRGVRRDPNAPKRAVGRPRKNPL